LELALMLLSIGKDLSTLERAELCQGDGTLFGPA
jgi:hypothetical protein